MAQARALRATACGSRLPQRPVWHAIASPATVRAPPPCCSSFGSAATAYASTLITCNANLILHSVPCPSSQAPPGGWRGIHDAVSPAEALPALWRELQEEGQEQQGQQQQLKYVASGATTRPSNGGSGAQEPTLATAGATGTATGQHPVLLAPQESALQQRSDVEQLQQQGLEQQKQGWCVACARALCDMVSDAAQSMGGGSDWTRVNAIKAGLDRAEEFVDSTRSVQLRWPALDPRVPDGDAADGGVVAGTGGRTADAQDGGQPWGQHSLDQLWVEVQAARGDGGRLAGLLGEERVNGLLGRDLAAGFGAAGWGGSARGRAEPGMLLGPWLGLGLRAAEGQVEATEVRVCGQGVRAGRLGRYKG